MALVATTNPLQLTGNTTGSLLTRPVKLKSILVTPTSALAGFTLILHNNRDGVSGGQVVFRAVGSNNGTSITHHYPLNDQIVDGLFVATSTDITAAQIYLSDLTDNNQD